MSCQRGNVIKHKQPKYQNKRAYKNDLHNSSKTLKFLNQMTITGCCKRCKDIIEWKIKYNKYKQLSQAKKCVKCLEKTVTNSYYVMCSNCSDRDKLCGKCCDKLPGETTTTTSAQEDDAREETEDKENIDRSLVIEEEEGCGKSYIGMTATNTTTSAASRLTNIEFSTQSSDDESNISDDNNYDDDDVINNFSNNNRDGIIIPKSPSTTKNPLLDGSKTKMSSGGTTNATTTNPVLDGKSKNLSSVGTANATAQSSEMDTDSSSFISCLGKEAGGNSTEQRKGPEDRKGVQIVGHRGIRKNSKSKSAAYNKNGDVDYSNDYSGSVRLAGDRHSMLLGVGREVEYQGVEIAEDVGKAVDHYGGVELAKKAEVNSSSEVENSGSERGSSDDGDNENSVNDGDDENATSSEELDTK